VELNIKTALFTSNLSLKGYKELELEAEDDEEEEENRLH
jgi:hypothetical protein